MSHYHVWHGQRPGGAGSVRTLFRHAMVFRTRSAAYKWLANPPRTMASQLDLGLRLALP